jgi:hypothetical protein
MLRILQINCLAGVAVMHCFLEVWRSASLAGVFQGMGMGIALVGLCAATAGTVAGARRRFTKIAE